MTAFSVLLFTGALLIGARLFLRPSARRPIVPDDDRGCEDEAGGARNVRGSEGW